MAATLPVGLVPNPEYQTSKLDKLTKFTDTTYGAFRMLQLIQKTTKAALLAFKDLGLGTRAYLSDLSGKLSTACRFLVIPYLPLATQNIIDGIKNFSHNSVQGVKSTFVDISKKIHDITDGIASWMYAAGLFTACNVTPAADLFKFAADLTEMCNTGANYKEVNRQEQLLKGNNREIADRFQFTKNLNFMKLVKCVFTVASGVFGILALTTGAALVSSKALFTMSFVTTVMAIAVHFYEKSGEWKPIKPFGPASANGTW